MKIRPYIDRDRSGCLAVFDSNAPTFFGGSDRDEFATFLDRQHEMGPYFVVEQADGIVACGGWGCRKEDPRVALLCWGMVARPHHRKGIGKLLLAHRLAEIGTERFDSVEIITSQHTASFFASAGFRELGVEPDLFAPGLHGHRMRLQLSALANRLETARPS